MTALLSPNHCGVDAAKPETGSVKLTALQGFIMLALLLILNSLLAALGSLVWGRFPYWSAFMVYALASVYFGFWGIVLAILTPVASSLLGIADAPPYLYVPVNLLQALLVVFAFRAFGINSTLATNSDRFKYIGLAIALPSLVGACSAWFLRSLMISNAGDPPLLNYAVWWVTENTVPAIFPGIWLHGALDQLYNPRTKKARDWPGGWLFEILKYTAPWMLTLLIAGTIVISIVSQQAGQPQVTPKIWGLVDSMVSKSPLLVGFVVAFNISILCSLAYTIGHARQACVLYKAICRHSPTQETALRLIKGKRAESKLRVLTIVFIDIRDFTQISNTFAPTELLRWLNTYFDRIDRPRLQHHGAVDKFIGDGVMLIFGLEDEKNNGARDAILYSLSALDELDSLNEEFRSKCFPEIRIGIGIHTGPVIVGEIGSRNRVEDTVIGDTVNYASRIEQKTKHLSDELLPVLLSRDTLQASGLLRDPSQFDRCFFPIQAELRGLSSVCLFAIKDAKLVGERFNQLEESPVEIPREELI